MVNKQICTKCIYDSEVAGVTFNEKGLCNLCEQVELIREKYGTGKKQGNERLGAIIKKIKSERKSDTKYDCLVGVSGGTDSSFLLHLLKKWGLNPLAVHYDNTWNTDVACQNIAKMLKQLDIDLYTYVIDNDEADDIFRSFFYADVAEMDCSTDLAIVEVMYRVAFKFKVKYIFEGHSFITEGITPLDRNYFDGRYIKQIHNKFGRIKLKSYPLMTYCRFLFWALILGVKRIRPFWYINYSKEEARKVLQDIYGWQYYGGHHLENRMSAYLHSVYFPQKFKLDLRANSISGRVREGVITRDEGLREYAKPPVVEKKLEQYFMKRLSLSQQEYEMVMHRYPKMWTEYKSYKKLFEITRPLFKWLVKRDRVPLSFYVKYCFPFKRKK